MKNISALLFVLLAAVAPLVTSAQEGDKDTAQGYLVLITNFIGDTLLPFLFALALLFFLVNVARYFIIGGSEAESQEKAKTLAIYGIGAFVFLISIWGIVNMFVSAFEIDDDEAKCPDYLKDWCGSSGDYENSGGGYERFGTYYEDTYNATEPMTLEEFKAIHANDPYDALDDEETDDQNSEPDEEVYIHNEDEDAVTTTEEESAPVNIGDTNPPRELGTCTTNASGIETCSF